MCEVEEVFRFGAESHAAPGRVVSVQVDCVQGGVDAWGAVGHAASEGVISEDVGLVGTAGDAAVGLIVTVVGRSGGTDRQASSGDIIGEEVVGAGRYTGHCIHICVKVGSRGTNFDTGFSGRIFIERSS